MRRRLRLFRRRSTLIGLALVLGFGLLAALAPVLAPLLLRSASKALLQRRPSDPPASPEAATPGTALVKPGAQAVPAANLGWADAEDVAAALGCDLCDPRDRRARR